MLVRLLQPLPQMDQVSLYHNKVFQNLQPVLKGVDVLTHRIAENS